MAIRLVLIPRKWLDLLFREMAIECKMVQKKGHQHPFLVDLVSTLHLGGVYSLSLKSVTDCVYKWTAVRVNEGDGRESSTSNKS